MKEWMWVPLVLLLVSSIMVWAIWFCPEPEPYNVIVELVTGKNDTIRNVISYYDDGGMFSAASRIHFRTLDSEGARRKQSYSLSGITTYYLYTEAP